MPKPLTVWITISSVQSLSHVRLFATPWIAARQASLSISNSWSSLKLMPIESVMPSSHLILCHPLLLLPPIRPSIRVFSNESTLCMRWPKYWRFSFSVSPSNEHPNPYQQLCPLTIAIKWKSLSSTVYDSMDLSLSELWELVMDREAWCAVIHGVTKSLTWLNGWSDLIWYPFVSKVPKNSKER